MFANIGLIAFSHHSKHNSHEAIEQSLDRITAYLEPQDCQSLKLTCRPFYYWFVTSHIWSGLKIGIAQQKLQYYDDFQFEEVQTKPISKRDKNIRIHSLKKQVQKKTGIRESSNIKHKAKAIHSNNELLFRNTEMGFKRLLKTNISQRPQSLLIPQFDETSPQQYLIRINEPWSVNMKKVEKLVGLMKKYNEFHHKFLMHLKSPCKDFHSLYVRLKQSESNIKQYYKQTTTAPLSLIIQSTEGANQGRLIDQHLNKVCKLFWTYHSSMLPMQKEIDAVLELCEDQRKTIQANKTSETTSIGFLQCISQIEELIQNFSVFLQKNPFISHHLCSVFVSVYSNALEYLENVEIYFSEKQYLQIKSISWPHLVSHSFFFQTLFQIYGSLSAKITKLISTHCSEDLTLAVIGTKLRNLKSISHSFVNITKYFGKLRKQLQQKKSKLKSEVIRNFLMEYENREAETLFQVKNPTKVQKWIAELKENINVLKSRMQG